MIFKKTLLIAIIMLFASVGYAQIIFEEGSFEELLKRAKSENKIIMVVGSATWCGPCKGMVNNIYSQVAAGEYFNKNFINLKFELDKKDPFNVKNRYGIGAYPTFFFINGDGVEVARVVGASATVEEFIDRARVANMKENLLTTKDLRFRKDLSYGVEYITYLSAINKNIDDVLLYYVTNRKVKKIYQEKGIEMCRDLINSVNSPAYRYIIDNGKQFSKVMGEAAYRSFVQDVASGILFNLVCDTFIKYRGEELKRNLDFCAANTLAATAFTELIGVCRDAVIDTQMDEIAVEAVKMCGGMNSKERVLTADYLLKKFKRSDNRDNFIKFVNIAIESESDIATKSHLQKIANRIK